MTLGEGEDLRCSVIERDTHRGTARGEMLAKKTWWKKQDKASDRIKRRAYRNV